MARVPAKKDVGFLAITADDRNDDAVYVREALHINTLA